MRIIAGKNKGTKLYTLEGDDITRPTLDRVKEALFNIIMPKLNGSIILDLFAGSGALGIEALSRGANKVVFCDNSPKAVNIIKNNVSKTRNEEKSQIIHKDYKKCLDYLSEKKIKFNIIFLDPPYKTNYIDESINIILEKNLLDEDGTIIIETDEKDRIIKQLEDKKVNIYDIRKYGRVNIIFLERKG